VRSQGRDWMAVAIDSKCVSYWQILLQKLNCFRIKWRI
jgi:hypothetical protein